MKQTFGQKIKNLRINNNLTGEQLGKVLGVTKTGISYWENNRSIPGGEMILKIANYFDVSVDYLLSEASKKTIDSEFISYSGDLMYTKNIIHTYINKSDRNEDDELYHITMSLSRIESGLESLADVSYNNKELIDNLFNNTNISKYTLPIYDNDFTNDELSEIAHYLDFIKSKRNW